MVGVVADEDGYGDGDWGEERSTRPREFRWRRGNLLSNLGFHPSAWMQHARRARRHILMLPAVAVTQSGRRSTLRLASQRESRVAGGAVVAYVARRVLPWSYRLS